MYSVLRAFTLFTDPTAQNYPAADPRPQRLSLRRHRERRTAERIARRHPRRRNWIGYTPLGQQVANPDGVGGMYFSSRAGQSYPENTIFEALYGNEGDDFLLGNPGAQNFTIDAGSGNDWIISDYNDTFSAFQGSTTYSPGQGTTVYAGDGHDAIQGGFRNDWIDAGPGHDQVRGNEGRDYINGGSGKDVRTSCGAIF